MAAIPIMSGEMRCASSNPLVGRSRGNERVILFSLGEVATLSVPDHKEIARGTLRSLIRAANLTTEEFVQARR